MCSHSPSMLKYRVCAVKVNTGNTVVGVNVMLTLTTVGKVFYSMHVSYTNLTLNRMPSENVTVILKMREQP